MKSNKYLFNYIILRISNNNKTLIAVNIFKSTIQANGINIKDAFHLWGNNKTEWVL